MGSIHIFHFLSLLLLSSLGVGFCGGDSCKPLQLTEHGPVIKFPFRIKEQQPPHCGYPAFDISYQDNNAFIHIPSMNRDFIVKHVDYKRQMMAVTPNRNYCFWRLNRNDCFLNNSSSISFCPFVFEGSYNYTFISCAKNVMDIHSDRPISCLSDSEHDVFMVGAYFDVAGMSVSCQPVKTVLMPQSYHLRYLGVGFGLRWDVPGSKECRWRGKERGFENEISNDISCLDRHDCDITAIQRTYNTCIDGNGKLIIQ